MAQGVGLCTQKKDHAIPSFNGVGQKKKCFALLGRTHRKGEESTQKIAMLLRFFGLYAKIAKEKVEKFMIKYLATGLVWGTIERTTKTSFSFPMEGFIPGRIEYVAKNNASAKKLLIAMKKAHAILEDESVKLHLFKMLPKTGFLVEVK